MFSLHARSRFVERGWSVTSLLRFFRDSWSESFRDMGAQPDRVRALWRFAAAFSLCATALIVLLPGPGGKTGLVVWTVSSALVLTGWVSLYVRLCDGAAPGRIGVPNYLTLLRFYLIAPVVVLLMDARYPAALALYIVLGLTDVADGVVARLRGPVTAFGVVMDPLADVLSTAAVFAALTASGVVPGWLLAILLARYFMLIVGSFLFFLLVGPIEFRATLPGKIVGVLQAMGVSAIVVALAVAPGVVEPMGRVLYPFLGLCFASIVVSQSVIGVRQRRRLRAQTPQAVDIGT